jgi:ABC-type taurine transport system ATPase subunit
VRLPAGVSATLEATGGLEMSRAPDHMARRTCTRTVLAAVSSAAAAAAAAALVVLVAEEGVVVATGAPGLEKRICQSTPSRATQDDSMIVFFENLRCGTYFTVQLQLYSTAIHTFIILIQYIQYIYPFAAY